MPRSARLRGCTFDGGTPAVARCTLCCLTDAPRADLVCPSNSRAPISKIQTAVLGIVITSVPFAKVGAKLAHSMDTRLLTRLFAVLLCVVGVRFLLY